MPDGHPRSVAHLTADIVGLAVVHGIRCDWRPRTSGRAWHKTRKVRLEAIRHAGHYAVALHEIAHVIHPPAFKGKRLEKELAAWLWARDNALVWDDEAAHVMRMCLCSYLSWCQRRKRAWIPPKTHPVWNEI